MDTLQLSGLQHFAYCRRQWALIHLEQQWQENERTAQGQIFHSNAHEGASHEKRGDVLILRGLRVFSERLNISGICDVVEFYRDPLGVTLPEYEGTWRPYPVEYKRGRPKENDADRLQLCAQAMCLEDMLLCSIPEGSLYYGETRRREIVTLDAELRDTAGRMLEEMQKYARDGYTPRARRTKGCNACSLKDVCLPGLDRLNAASYIQQYLEDDS